LGTRAYPRLRLGIGRRSQEQREITDYVLGHFEADERKTMEEVLDRAVRQVECWLADGIEKAMNEFNGAVTAPAEKGKQ
jgi:PTH1 family peptidyl-tRNA hydrolase